MRTTLAAIALSAVCSLTPSARAEPLVLTQTGSINADTTIGGVALGQTTDFTFTATFDTAIVSAQVPGGDLYEADLKFDVAGHGTYTADPGSGFYALIASDGGRFLVGVTDAQLFFGFAGFYDQVTAGFDAENPTPATFTGLSGRTGGSPFSIPLQGVSGGLVVDEIASLGATATLGAAPGAAVPEPSSLLLGTVGATDGIAWRSRARRLRPA